MSFDGRVALITGGSQGLGYATAALLKEKGASGLLLVGRDQAKGEAAAASLTGDGCRAVFASADLADPDGPERCVAAADETFGTLHATVNCAAATFRGSVWDSTAAMWDEMMALNVRAACLVAQESAKLMVREDVDGSIVLIGSVARHGGAPNLLPYSASKMALVAATRNMAFTLMRHRVRVNMLNPGWMDTPAEDITQRRYEGATDGWLERAEAVQPMGKLIKPDEIAHTIVHLCSPESGFLTGQDIDWDQTILGVAAKLVGAAVIQRRNKLIKQIPVAHVDLDRIEARLNAELCALHKPRDHLVHVTLVHGASEHVAAQQARGIEPAAGTLERGRHKGTRNE
ncbi:MAG: SDR family oxidoreductase [Actinobacteria bacterium]|nr:SDR family oxidoreductase [Actinomycetota bacterium]